MSLVVPITLSSNHTRTICQYSLSVGMLWESNNYLAPIHVLPVFEAVQILEEGRHAFTHGAADHGDISSQKKTRQNKNSNFFTSNESLWFEISLIDLNQTPFKSLIVFFLSSPNFHLKICHRLKQPLPLERKQITHSFPNFPLRQRVSSDSNFVKNFKL